DRFIPLMGLVATLSLMGWFPALPIHAADQPSAKSTPSAPGGRAEHCVGRCRGHAEGLSR
ncbi:MAG: hypothetical protein ACREJU_08025, partial [Nitrospiraceae bacterium]